VSEIAIIASGVALVLVGIVSVWVRFLARRLARLEIAITGIAALGGDQ